MTRKGQHHDDNNQHHVHFPLQAVFGENNLACRRAHGISKAAQDQWSKDHEVFYHHDQKQIELDQNLLFPLTLCRKHGVCVCGQHPKSCPEALLIFNKFAAQMRALFKKTKTHITQQRLLLEKAYIVLRFRALPEESTDGPSVAPPVPPDLYVHLGYVNFSSWRCSVMQLAKVSDCNEHGNLQLTPLCSLRGVQHHGIETFVEFAAHAFDFNHHYTTKIFELVCDDDNLLTAEYMVGSCLEVKEFSGIGEFSLWLGKDHEKAALKTLKYSKSKSKSVPPLAKKQKTELTDSHADADGRHKRVRVRRAKQSVVSMPLLSMLGPGNAIESENDMLAQALEAEWPASDDSLDSVSVVDPLQNFGLEAEESDLDFEEDEEIDEVRSVVSSAKEPENPDSDAESAESFFGPILEALNADSSCDSEPALDSMTTPLNQSKDASSDDRSDSDSSSSSSTDSSSSSHRVRNRPASSVDRKAPIAERSIFVGRHQIHYNVTGEYMRAHCGLHDGCRRQRTCRPSTFAFHNQGQGRPLGLLLSWLESGDSHDDKASHVKALASSAAERRAARQKFKEVHGAEEFLALERPQRDDEYSEPDDIV